MRQPEANAIPLDVEAADNGQTLWQDGRCEPEDCVEVVEEERVMAVQEVNALRISVGNQPTVSDNTNPRWANRPRFESPSRSPHHSLLLILLFRLAASRETYILRQVFGKFNSDLSCAIHLT